MALLGGKVALVTGAATPMMRSSTAQERIDARAKSDPLGRIGTPQDAAEMVLFLATSGGEIMTGQVLQVRMLG